MREAMAQEQLALQTSRFLISDSKRELVAKRISEKLELKLIKERLKKEEKNLKLEIERVRKPKITFCNLFIGLCEKYFGFDKFDLANITDREELLILECEVFNKAKLGFKITKYLGIPFMALIPMLGWICLMCMQEDINSERPVISVLYMFYYCRLRKKLIKTYGKDFLPFETLAQMRFN